MKLKNINPLELHVEKAVLALGVLYAAAVVYLFFLGQPYAVTMSGSLKTPAEVEDVLVKIATNVESAISDNGANPLGEMSVPPYTQLFKDTLARKVLDEQSYLAPLSGRWGLEKSVIGEVTKVDDSAEAITPPKPPPAENLLVRRGHYVLGDDSLRGHVGAGDPDKPADFWAVSVAATYPTDAWHKSLGELEKRRIQFDWLQKVRMVVDVVAERQVNRGGRWGASVEGKFEEFAWETVGVVPSSVSYRDAVARSEWKREEAKDLVEDLKALQTQVTLARFPELAKQSPIWLAPGTNLDRWAKVDIDELSRLNNLEQKLIDQLIKTGGAKAVQIEEEKKDARGAQAAPKKAEPGAKPEERDPAKAARIASLQKELLDVRAKIAELRTKYEQAEAAPDPKDPAGKAKPAPAPKPPAAPESDADRERRRREEALKPIPLLVHDLNVQPGETYRYRLRTVLLNPVFQEANLIKRHPELAKMGALLGLASEPTPATPPVQIPERHYMFATKLADKSSRVTTEVWHLFNGKWRAEQFGPVTPGDPVGGRVQVKDSGFDVVVDLTLPYLLVDVNAVGSLGVEGTRYEVLFLDQRSSQVLSRDPRAELTNSLRQQLSNQQQGGPIALAR